MLRNRILNSLSPVAASLALVLALGLAVNAETITEINEAGGLLVGDKLFSDFSVISVVAGGVGIAPDASAIEVTGINADGNWGIQFNGAWLAGVNAVVNSTITFKAAIADPATNDRLIDGNYLVLTASTVELPDGLVNVIENVFDGLPTNGRRVAQKQVWDTPANSKLVDSAMFTDPVTGDPLALPEIWVKKDITLFGGTDGTAGFTHLSEFVQTFTQTPEPGTAAMSLIGALSLIGYSCRRRRR